MTNTQMALTIAIAAAATIATRFLPFILLPKDKETPAYLQYLGKVLPPALFGMLVIYSLKDTNWLGATHGAPELIAIFVTLILHIYKRNMLISIAAGTIVYMLLVQMVFV